MLFLKMRKKSFALKKINIKRNNSQKDLKIANKYSDFFKEDDNINNLPYLKNQSTKDFCHFNIKSRRIENEESLLTIFDIDNIKKSSYKTSNRSEIKHKDSIKNKSLFNNNKKDIKNNENYNKKSLFVKKLSINKEINNNKRNNRDLMNAYKGNYKFYEMNKLPNAPTIISEEPGYEESLARDSSFNITSLRTSLLNNNNKRLSNLNNIKNENHNQIDEKEKEEKKDSYDKKTVESNIYRSPRKSKFKNEDISCDGLEEFKKKYILNQEKSKKSINKQEKSDLIKSNSSSSSSEENENNKILSNNPLKELNNTPYKAYEINEEIYPGEKFNIPNIGDNLLDKKLSLSYFDEKEKFIENKNDLNEHSKLLLILESNNNNSYMNINESVDNMQKNSLTDMHKKKSKNILLKKNQQLKKENFSIITNAQFEILSIYENINKLSNFEFHKNKSLQNKIKIILKEKPDSDDTNSFSSSNNGYVNNKPKYH